MKTYGNRPSALGMAARLGFAALLVGLLVHQGWLDPVRLARAVLEQPGWMSGAVAFHGAIFLFLAVRWSLLARPAGVAIPFPLGLRLTLISHFFSSCLPGNGAGDLFKGWILARRGPSFPTVLGTMALDRALGMIGLFMGWATSLWTLVALRPELRGLLVPIAMLATLVFVLGFGAILLAPRIGPRIPRPTPGAAAWKRRLREALVPLVDARAPRSALALALALSLGTQASLYLATWCCARVLGLSLSPLEIGAFTPLSALANAIPLSPGGLGIGESVTSISVSRLGFSPDTGASLMLLLRMAIVAWALVGLVAWLTLPRGEETPNGGDRLTVPPEDR